MFTNENRSKGTNRIRNEAGLYEEQIKFLRAYTSDGPTMLDIKKSCLEAGISKSLFYAWRRDEPNFLQAYTAARDIWIQMAEQNVKKLLRSGDADITKFVLKYLGKQRDWNPTQNVDITSGGESIQVIFAKPGDIPKQDEDIE